MKTTICTTMDFRGLSLPLLPLLALLALLPALALAHGEHAPLDPDMKIPDRIEAVESPFGRMGARREATRVIDVQVDARQRVTPSTLDFSHGETIHFRARNDGDTVCQFLLGTVDDIRAQHELSRRQPGGVFDSPSSQRLRPGRNAEIVWEFTRIGEFAYACVSGASEFDPARLGAIRVTGQETGRAITTPTGTGAAAGAPGAKP